MSRPFAVFDIDGTVVRWQLYHALADELARQGLLDQTRFQAVRQTRMTWKRRESENSFQDYERALVELVDGALSDIRLSDFEAACDHVMAEYKDQVYTYTRNLIEDLRSKHYLLFAISASQSQIVERFATYYGFDDFGGSEYEVKDGYFTGRKLVLLKRERKPELLNQLVDKHGGTWEGSLAAGDSESDIPMLGSVEQPIAFNPTRELFDHARANSWKIVVERKNMVYELEPQKGKHGSYILVTPKA